MVQRRTVQFIVTLRPHRIGIREFILKHTLETRPLDSPKELFLENPQYASFYCKRHKCQAPTAPPPLRIAE